VTLTILIPVKHLSDSKSRLAPVLAGQERQALALRLLRGVLGVAQQAQQQLGTLAVVVSPDPAVLALAAAYGLTPLPEDSAPLSGYELRVTDSTEPALNAALEQATAFACARGASAVLVLPADLPLLTLADVARLWRASQQLYADRAMVIAPDGQEQGTNALLVRPPGALPYQFGPGSFQRHCQQARDLGLAWHIDRSPRLGLDVDLPADLEHWLAIEQADRGLAGEHPTLEEIIMHDDRHASPLDDSTVAFLHEPGLLMRLGTVGGDGYPQVTPIWYLYDEGIFWITTASDRVKARNMLARPQVGFAIDSDQRPYRGVSARGEARLIAEGEAARPMTRRIAARYVPPERLEAMVDTLMEAPRVVFAIDAPRVVKMGSW
jgi:2-phospho-L-lactate guanylyltransferase